MKNTVYLRIASILLHVHCRRPSQAKNQKNASFLLGSLFDPEDGGSMSVDFYWTAKRYIREFNIFQKPSP
jgi:hypothetical protein